MNEEAKRIVSDHKVFWTVVPIELSEGKGEIVRVGMALVLVGTDNSQKGRATVLDDLFKLAESLIPEETPHVRTEVRKRESEVFYLPGGNDPERKNYVVGIRILHAEEFDRPVDEHQTALLRDIEGKLKEIGCRKEQWKEPD
jgi:hypothetical protein